MSIIFFAIWIFFFDTASVLEWITQMSENRGIRRDIEHYDQQVMNVENQLKYMHSNNDSIEKYARENYFMKYPNEEVFIIE